MDNCNQMQNKGKLYSAPNGRVCAVISLAQYPLWIGRWDGVDSVHKRGAINRAICGPKSILCEFAPGVLWLQDLHWHKSGGDPGSNRTWFLALRRFSQQPSQWPHEVQSSPSFKTLPSHLGCGDWQLQWSYKRGWQTTSDSTTSPII